MPTLLIHGDDDQIVPIGGASRIAVTLVYPGAADGLMVTERDRFHADLLAFIQG